MIKSALSTLIFFWIAISGSYSQHQHKITETVTFQYYDTSKDSSLYKDVSEFDSNGNLLVDVFLSGIMNCIIGLKVSNMSINMIGMEIKCL
jgi:hypothetical protein